MSMYGSFLGVAAESERIRITKQYHPVSHPGWHAAHPHRPRAGRLLGSVRRALGGRAHQCDAPALG